MPGGLKSHWLPGGSVGPENKIFDFYVIYYAKVPNNNNKWHIKSYKMRIANCESGGQMVASLYCEATQKHSSLG